MGRERNIIKATSKAAKTQSQAEAIPQSLTSTDRAH